MRHHEHSRARRARRLPTLVVGCACLLAAMVPAVSSAAGDPLADAPITDLTPVEAVPDAPAAGATARQGGTDAAAVTTERDPFVAGDGVGEAVARDLAGTIQELRSTRERLDGQRASLQLRLLSLADARERAEQRLDRASERLATRLVELLETGRDARLQALIAVRELDPSDGRAQLVAGLHAAERSLVAEQDAAAGAAAVAGAEADEVRLDVLALGTRIAALDAAVQDRSRPDAAQRARDRGDRYSVDADLIFATGPIPGIGYWGQAAGGGSALSGWMGYAGAAVGGVGCAPPEPALKATGRIEQGEASWYGPGFHGNATASGERYDQRALTAAHRTLPFGTIVRVYSSATARCVFVRINDRGPFIDGRIIDLSQAAAERIGMSGVAPVQVEVWSTPRS